MQLGLDNSSIGYFVLSDNDKVIDLCKVPQPLNMYKEEIKIINKEIKELEPFLCIKGQKGKTEEKIKILKRRIISLNDSDPKDISRVLEWLTKYKESITICYIEGLIYQTNDASSVKSFMKLAEYFGICQTCLDIVGIKYKVIPIQEWRKHYDYKETPKKLSSSDRKKFVKSESIRISGELIKDIDKFWIPKGCRVINDNICESSLLANLKL